MRMMPSRYTTQAKPLQVKQAVSQVAHISAPLKGLSLSSKLVPGDPLTAAILTNFVIENDRIQCRSGFFKVATVAGAIETLVPWYGTVPQLAAAAGGSLYNAATGALLKGGFNAAGNDWSSTAFTNLSQVDYTVMCNGMNGVWSWDGTLAAGGFVKEAVTANAADTWIVPDQFQIVLAHMNRLWFADSSNLAVYYLPLQQKAGEVKKLPLNALFRRGGSIRAMGTWTVEGGVGVNDQLVIFSTNGECVIYQGTDPDDAAGGNWQLTGIFRFDAPMSKHCVMNYGGDLWCLISTGLVPMSTLLKAEGEQLGKEDQNIVTLFREASQLYRDRPGWSCFMNPTTGRAMANLPGGASNLYRQAVRHMPAPVWSTWENVPARCWCWIDPYLYFGDDLGNTYRLHRDYLSDNGLPIRCDVQMAWSNFKTPALKHFKMLQPYFVTDGNPIVTLDMAVDYKYAEPVNEPDVTFSSFGATWDTADWDTSDWAESPVEAQHYWQGVASKGNVGGPRLVARVKDCRFAVAGFDVLFETGAAVG